MKPRGRNCTSPLSLPNRNPRCLALLADAWPEPCRLSSHVHSDLVRDAFPLLLLLQLLLLAYDVQGVVGAAALARPREVVGLVRCVARLDGSRVLVVLVHTHLAGDPSPGRWG